MERLSQTPGFAVAYQDVVRYAAWHREFARRFGDHRAS
jgi:hypothetical protein